MFDGSLLGDGGARKAAGWGLGARFRAGEKCCWRVENAGLRSCDSVCGWRDDGSCNEFRFGGRKTVEVAEFKRVDDDFVRVCPEDRELPTDVLPVELLEAELIEVLRRWRDVTIGGLDRSFLTGSASGRDGALALSLESDLCNPLVEGLLVWALEDRGCA